MGTSRFTLAELHSQRHAAPLPRQAGEGQEGSEGLSAGVRLYLGSTGPLAVALPDSPSDLRPPSSPVQASVSSSVKTRGLACLTRFVARWICGLSENSQCSKRVGLPHGDRAWWALEDGAQALSHQSTSHKGSLTPCSLQQQPCKVRQGTYQE